ncbi:hypothetical protein ACFE04_005088 [Oxalis oulophora]
MESAGWPPARGEWVACRTCHRVYKTILDLLDHFESVHLPNNCPVPVNGAIGYGVASNLLSVSPPPLLQPRPVESVAIGGLAHQFHYLTWTCVMLAMVPAFEKAYGKHPQHELLKSLANKDYGFGGLLGLDMENEDRSNRSTSSKMNEAEKILSGIFPGLVRMSVGYIETLEQKWSQFEKAMIRHQD